MLHVETSQIDNVVHVQLSGSMEEAVHLAALIGPPPTAMEVNCKGIVRINSVGIKAWMNYFQLCRSQGTRLKFVECSMVVIEQSYLISNFIDPSEIESVSAPFFCIKCDNQLTALLKSTDLKQETVTHPTLTCHMCDGPVTFDESAI